MADSGEQAAERATKDAEDAAKEADKAAEQRAADDAKAVKEGEKQRAEDAEQAEKALNGEVPLNDPESKDWPDDVPMQSRFGDPKDTVIAQSQQSEQAPEDVVKAGPLSGDPVEKADPAKEPAKAAPAPATPDGPVMVNRSDPKRSGQTK